MIHQNSCAEAINTTCYVLNQTLIRPILKKTPYKLWSGIKPTLHYFHVFGCKCFIHNNKDNLSKFDAKTYDGIFISYSTRSKAYRAYILYSRMIEETIDILFCETNPNDARNGGSIENNYAGQSRTRQNTIEMWSTQNQENLQIDN